MLGAMSEIFTLANAWKERGNGPYLFLGWCASILVLASLDTETTPSQLLTELSRFLGADALAQWLGEWAALLPAELSLAAHGWAIILAALVFCFMVLGPLSRMYWEQRVVFDYADAVGSRASATFWLLLLVAAQYGDIAGSLPRIEMLVPGLLGFALFFISLPLAAVVVKRRLLAGTAHVGAELAERLFMYGAAATIATVGVPFFPVGRFIRWLLCFERDPDHRAGSAAVQALDMPTGAAPLTRGQASLATMRSAP